MVLTSRRQNQQKHRPFVIPIFLPHAGCPHQCVFCNQVSITGVKQNTVGPDQFRRQIRQFLEYKKEGRKPVQIAFFGGNFLGLKQEEIESWLELAGEFVSQGLVDGIRFSTRPDTIDAERLDILENYPVATVELGVNPWMIRYWCRPGGGTVLQIPSGRSKLLKSGSWTSDCK